MNQALADAAFSIMQLCHLTGDEEGARECHRIWLEVEPLFRP